MSAFTDQVVLITGAASGIGRTTAETFAAQGAKVMVSDLNESGGAETVEHIRAAGGEAAFVKADVADVKEVEAMVRQTVETFGRLDIGINNAGMGGPWQKSHEYPLEAWDRVIAVNQTGVFYCMKFEIEQMLKQGAGCIVNVSSVAGLKALPNCMPYTATKHAVLGMTKTAALEYARHKIRINAVCPSFTRSAMVDQMLGVDPSLEERLKKLIPLRRYGQPEDIANGILWLCEESSSFVTGLCLPLDGGMMAT